MELSGQGRWQPETLDYTVGVSIETEVARAFDNIAFMLNSIGLSWSHVAHVNSHHVPEADAQITKATAEVVRQFGIRMPNHKPCLGVAVLGDRGMRVEVRVTAFRE